MPRVLVKVVQGGALGWSLSATMSPRRVSRHVSGPVETRREEIKTASGDARRTEVELAARVSERKGVIARRESILATIGVVEGEQRAFAAP